MEQIEEYTLVSEIGGGNFGKVYKAVDPSGQEFAVKKILTRGVNQKLKELIENETRVMESAEHPNILKLVKVIHRSQIVYIVTELCTGGDLEGYLKSHGPIPERIARKWIRDLANALNSLKQKSIMHRDIKVANILLSSADVETLKVKLCDFGFSKYLTRSIAQTQLGTPLYMAPEIFHSTSYNYKVDIWSLGVVAYEILCGRPPFQCFRLEELKRLQREPIEFQENVSPLAQEFVRMLLTYDPATRPDYEAILSHEFLSLDSDLQGIVDHFEDFMIEEEYEILGDVESVEDVSETLPKPEENKAVASEEVKQQPVVDKSSQRLSVRKDQLRQSVRIYAEKEIHELSFKIQSQKAQLDKYKNIQETYKQDEMISLFFLKFKSHYITELIQEIDKARHTYSNSSELAEILDEVFVDLQMEKLEIMEAEEKLQSRLKSPSEEIIKSHLINEGYEIVANPKQSSQAMLLFQAAYELYPHDEVIFEFIQNSSS